MCAFGAASTSYTSVNVALVRVLSCQARKSLSLDNETAGRLMFSLAARFAVFRSDWEIANTNYHREIVRIPSWFLMPVILVVSYIGV